SLLNEPIPGQGVFWSSVGGKPYPVSLRVLFFEHAFAMRDKNYNLPGGNTYADTLRNTFVGVQHVTETAHAPEGEVANSLLPDLEEPEPIDVMASLEDEMAQHLKSDSKLMAKIDSEEGAAWGSIKAFFLQHLRQELDDRDQLAYQLVPKVMT